MTTITKERLLTIKQWRETYGPGSNVVLPAEEAEELARIALASLEAEPVAWMRDDADGREYNARNEFSGGGGGVPLYATPPVPVVPEEKPMPNPLSMYAVDAVAAIAEVRGWNACRAAMLHGAEPVSQTYKSQHTQFEQVADLYEMQFDDGRTCAFHTDAQKAAQWLQACDGNRVQEYVKLERLRNALSGNSPVTPDGWISCSERMPEDTKMLLAFSQGEIVAAYWNWVVNPIDYKKYRAFTYLSGNILDDVTHWMPLPEPPQEGK
ncbi:TPA: DUF551 domain-containing protein [Escherichia coli]|nr:DUF551 domain-containing protein [Escherichia coli]EFJ0489133.1 DUF551 domain-containing protein [Escherichia coli]EFU2695752.1 DUF551 domain-containing protein [Escherichia coli]HEC4359074.1 DUF551 domain-containing protein [Escherichia coli]